MMYNIGIEPEEVTLKKSIILLLAVILIACAPAQAISTEIPATEESEYNPDDSIVVPTNQSSESVVQEQSTKERQQTGRITVYYHFDPVIPVNWITGVENNFTTYTFDHGEMGWKTVETDVYLKQFGPLFPGLVVNSLSNKNGNCPVNTYYSDEQSQSGYISFQPLCETISGEESLEITFGLSNCQKDLNDSLICKLESDFGVLYYNFDAEMTKFQFTFSGTWNYEYQNWITESLAILEFQTIPSDFFDNVAPGANYTIYKN